jgi:hypothetical protein
VSREIKNTGDLVEALQFYAAPNAPVTWFADEQGRICLLTFNKVDFSSMACPLQEGRPITHPSWLYKPPAAALKPATCQQGQIDDDCEYCAKEGAD